MTEADILKLCRWPSNRAVSVAMVTFECGEDEAIAALVDMRVLISKVRREFALSLEDAAIAVARVSPLVPGVMARHGFTKDVAVLELIRFGG
jgi:hypothetical protein